MRGLVSGLPADTGYGAAGERVMFQPSRGEDAVGLLRALSVQLVALPSERAAYAGTGGATATGISSKRKGFTTGRGFGCCISELAGRGEMHT